MNITESNAVQWLLTYLVRGRPEDRPAALDAVETLATRSQQALMAGMDPSAARAGLPSMQQRKLIADLVIMWRSVRMLSDVQHDPSQRFVQAYPGVADTLDKLVQNAVAAGTLVIEGADGG